MQHFFSQTGGVFEVAAERNIVNNQYEGFLSASPKERKLPTLLIFAVKSLNTVKKRENELSLNTHSRIRRLERNEVYPKKSRTSALVNRLVHAVRAKEPERS